MKTLNQFDYLSLYLGGEDGGIIKNAGAVTDQKCHLLEVMEDGCTFTVMTGANQLGEAVNFMTANNYTGFVFDKGDYVYAPDGGYIGAYTADKKVRQYTMCDHVITKQ